MPEPSDRIASIQADANAAIQEAAIKIRRIGGPNAVGAYLNDALCNLLGVAIDQQGMDEACELMARGLLTAEAFDENSHGRCAP